MFQNVICWKFYPAWQASKPWQIHCIFVQVFHWKKMLDISLKYSSKKWWGTNTRARETTHNWVKIGFAPFLYHFLKKGLFLIKNLLSKIYSKRKDIASLGDKLTITKTCPFLYSKTGVYRGIHYFSYFCSKHRLWVLVRTASPRSARRF